DGRARGRGVARRSPAPGQRRAAPALRSSLPRCHRIRTFSAVRPARPRPGGGGSPRPAGPGGLGTGGRGRGIGGQGAAATKCSSGGGHPTPDGPNRTMTLRICHLGKFYPPAPGGVETHVQTLARAQARAGADVQVVCVNHRDTSSTDVTWRPFGTTPTVVESDQGVRVTRLGRRASLSRLDMCPSLPAALWRLRNEGIDIVHVHAP